MLKRTSVKFGLLIMIALLGAGLLLASSRMVRRTGIVLQSARAKDVTSLKDNLTSKDIEAADTRPLKERARQSGKFIANKEPSDTSTYVDLATLANQSNSIVIGTPQQNVCNVSSDGRDITIDYQVNLKYVYKGTQREGDTITVSIPGGIAKFPDGTSAEIRTPWFRKMSQGATYLLFLNRVAGSSSFKTTGEAKGVFEIPTDSDNRNIRIHTGISEDPIHKYQNMNVIEFLKEIRKAVKKASKG